MLRRTGRATLPAGPEPAVSAVGWVIALWCVGFAAVNVVYEATGRLDDGDYGEYATGLAVMSWLVLIIKLVGAAVAILAVCPLPRYVSPRMVGVSLWGGGGTAGAVLGRQPGAGGRHVGRCDGQSR